MDGPKINIFDFFSVRDAPAQAEWEENVHSQMKTQNWNKTRLLIRIFRETKF
jgi:hypothetical protein